MSDTLQDRSDQLEMQGSAKAAPIEVIFNDARRSVSRYSARLDSLLFDPPYLLDAGLSYAMRILHGEAQIWQVESGRKGVTWIEEAKRASGPPLA